MESREEEARNNFRVAAGNSGQSQTIEDEIVNSLVLMYGATNNEERNIYYERLCKIAEDSGNFIKSILKVFYGDYNKHQKLSVTIYFKSYLNNLIIKKGLNSEARKDLFEELLKILFQ
jgi:hypothetical protein